MAKTDLFYSQCRSLGIKTLFLFCREKNYFNQFFTTVKDTWQNVGKALFLFCREKIILINSSRL